MSEYTPTTEEVREAAYEHGATGVSYEEFDRWLAAHDREVAAGALRDAADGWHGSTHGPRQWLLDRADQIEEGRNDK